MTDDDLSPDQKDAEKAAEKWREKVTAGILAALMSLRSNVKIIAFVNIWADFEDELTDALDPVLSAADEAATALWGGYDPMDPVSVDALFAFRRRFARQIVDATRRAVEKAQGIITGDDAEARLEAVAGLNANQIVPALDAIDIEGAARKALEDRAGTLAEDALWEAVQLGRLSAARQEQRITNAGVVKTWETARDERVCETCGALDGVSVPVNQAFPGGFMTSPAHSLCRCHISYSTAED